MSSIKEARESDPDTIVIAENDDGWVFFEFYFFFLLLIFFSFFIVISSRPRPHASNVARMKSNMTSFVKASSGNENRRLHTTHKLITFFYFCVQESTSVQLAALSEEHEAHLATKTKLAKAEVWKFFHLFVLIYFARGVFALLTFYLFKKKKSLQNTIDELRTQNSQLQSELAAKNIELARISETLKQQRQNQDAGQVRNKRKRKKKMNSFFPPVVVNSLSHFVPPFFF